MTGREHVAAAVEELGGLWLQRESRRGGCEDVRGRDVAMGHLIQENSRREHRGAEMIDTNQQAAHRLTRGRHTGLKPINISGFLTWAYGLGLWLYRIVG